MLSRTVNGPAIREIRERAGMSIQDVINAMADQGLSYNISTLYKIERGDTQPSPKVFVALAKIMNCDQDRLLVAVDSAA